MTTEPAHITVESFNEAFNHRDVDAVMNMVTDDIIFENTSGGRFVGKEAVRAVLTRAFELMSMGRFETEDLFVAESDRCVVLWTYIFNREEPEHGSVRGVDVFRVREGKVAQKFSYVKSEDFVKKLGLELPRV
jgi:steroid delta-isomerase-like uncharacterized protein